MSPPVSLPPVVVSLLTPPGRGALAVVGVAGEHAAAFVDRAFAPLGGRTVAAREDGAIAVGTWRETGEEVVVVRRREDLVEVHCHGGMAAASAVTASLVAVGGADVPWSRWLAAAGEPETAVEAREALARADGPKAARILARQLAGALDAEIARIDGLRRSGNASAAGAAAARLLRAARVGLRLTRPWRVVLVGAVNAGKSSLVNALAGHGRCIVSPEPGTTRDVVKTRLVLDGWEVDLVDTAGEREGAGAVERDGIARGTAAAAEADLVLRVVPADDGSPVDAGAGEMLVVAKSDLRAAAGHWPAPSVLTSAATGTGITELAAAIVDQLVPEERSEPELLTGAVPFTRRQVEALAAIAEGRPPPTSRRRLSTLEVQVHSTCTNAVHSPRRHPHSAG